MPTHGRDSVIDLLLESPERLESGLTTLDARLRLDDAVEVDALLRDSLGYPVVVLLVRGDVGAELGRVAAIFSALQRGRFLLQRLYGEQGLDPSLRPRFVLLAPRFPDHTGALLEMLGGVEVVAYEYRVVGGAGRPVLDLGLFHRTRGPAPPPAVAWTPAGPAALPATAPAAPAPAAPAASRRGPPDADPGTPVAARGWFLRARESIRALSSLVTESQHEGQVQYRVNDAPLATLTLDQHGFRLRCGPQGSELAVADEETLNRGLNSVFELYFNELGPERQGG
ncbi:MAG: hypothetical protein FJ296_11650 [Planctomycetes bacterium]|nr:hypothetical protein [Planctomycetota bacterium]